MISATTVPAGTSASLFMPQGFQISLPLQGLLWVKRLHIFSGGRVRYRSKPKWRRVGDFLSSLGFVDFWEIFAQSIPLQLGFVLGASTRIDKMGEPFSVQISASLVQRLVGEEDRRPRRKSKPKAPRSDPKKNDSPLIEAKHSKETDIPQVEAKASREKEGWQPRLPLLPGAVFPPSVDNELNPIREVLHESERVVEKLKKEEARMAEEVKHKAKELHEKEYRMPEQKSVPCSSFKDACVQCYKDHPKDPLQCAETVKAFVECARQVNLQFVASG